MSELEHTTELENGMVIDESDTDQPDTEGELPTGSINIPEQPKINTVNEFLIGYQMGTLRFLQYPEIKNKQQAYRCAAWLISMAEVLDDDPAANHSFEEILAAVQAGN